MGIILQNQELLVSIITLLIVAIIARFTGKTLDKTKVTSALGIIFEIVQDIAFHPQTRDLDSYSKKQLAVDRAVKTLPEKHSNILIKTFGTIGTAIEYVYHNRKWLTGIGRVFKGAV